MTNTCVCVRLRVYLSLIINACVYVGRRDCEYMCTIQGPSLLKTADSKINIQAPTRFSKEEQGVMGDAGKIITVQRWKVQSEEKSRENNTGEK